jgi:hypothetical protein
MSVSVVLCYVVLTVTLRSICCTNRYIGNDLLRINLFSADSRLHEQRRALVNVFHDGSILWMPQAILRSTCEFKTTFFPFDENECHLKFGSWTHDGNLLDLRFFDGKEKFLIEDFIPGNEWDLVGNRGERNVKFYECCKNTPFLDLKFYILLKRKTAFYSFILLLPCTLLSCLTLVIFWVPPEAPAKLMLGETRAHFSEIYFFSCLIETMSSFYLLHSRHVLFYM